MLSFLSSLYGQALQNLQCLEQHGRTQIPLKVLLQDHRSQAKQDPPARYGRRPRTATWGCCWMEREASTDVFTEQISFPSDASAWVMLVAFCRNTDWNTSNFPPVDFIARKLGLLLSALKNDSSSIPSFDHSAITSWDPIIDYPERYIVGTIRDF